MAEETKQESAEEVFEKNKRDALRLARDIYNTVLDPEFIKIDPVERMRIVQEKVPEFCKVYPTVVRWMVRDLKYNEKAFVEYLNMLDRDHRSGKQVEPGKGYLEYIRKQCEYSRILYKHSVPHWNAKTAAKIFNTEYDAMLKTYNEMKKEETEVRSEFDEEKATHKNEKISEILDFIQSMKGGGDDDAPVEEGVEVGTTETHTRHPKISDKDMPVVLEKIRKVAGTIDYRVQQAKKLEEQLKKGQELPDLPKDADGNLLPLAIQDDVEDAPVVAPVTEAPVTEAPAELEPEPEPTPLPPQTSTSESFLAGTIVADKPKKRSRKPRRK
jgi:hypothetical protein